MKAYRLRLLAAGLEPIAQKQLSLELCLARTATGSPAYRCDARCEARFPRIAEAVLILPDMNFRCIVSYRTSRSNTISTWRTTLRSRDIVSATADLIAELKRRQRRALTVVGIYIHAREPAP